MEWIKKRKLKTEKENAPWEEAGRGKIGWFQGHGRK
jgi:hypothetical protein